MADELIPAQMLLGHRRDGRPIWLVCGAEDEDLDDEDTDATDEINLDDTENEGEEDESDEEDEEEDEDEEDEGDVLAEFYKNPYADPYLGGDSDDGLDDKETEDEEEIDADGLAAFYENAGLQMGGDSDDEETDDDEEEPADGYVAPSQEEWRRTQAALTRANNEAKKYRLRAKALAQQTPPTEPGPSADDADDEQYEQALAAAAAVEQRLKPVAIKSAARAALLAAGLRDATAPRLARVYRLLDLEALDVDEEGEVTGLEEQIIGVKKDYPELFTPSEPPRRKRPPVIDAADRKPPVDYRNLTTGQRIAASVLGDQ